MRVQRPISFRSCAGPLVVFFVLLLSLPVGLVFVRYPFGINDRPKLEQNFRERRPALEAVVDTARAGELTTAKLGFLGLTADEQPELQDDRRLRRAMRQARIQKLELVSRKPFVVRLVTDETPTLFDTTIIDVYGYIYTDDSDRRHLDSYGSSNRLHRNWYLFDDELYLNP